MSRIGIYLGEVVRVAQVGGDVEAELHVVLDGGIPEPNLLAAALSVPAGIFYNLTTDQSDAGRAGIFSPRTNRKQDARVYTCLKMLFSRSGSSVGSSSC
eukprot:2188488-Pyramimonas_sp.AAC.3